MVFWRVWGLSAFKPSFECWHESWWTPMALTTSFVSVIQFPLSQNRDISIKTYSIVWLQGSNEKTHGKNWKQQLARSKPTIRVDFYLCCLKIWLLSQLFNRAGFWNLHTTSYVTSWFPSWLLKLSVEKEQLSKIFISNVPNWTDYFVKPLNFAYKIRTCCKNF